MSSISPITGNIPFHIAKAYGLQPAQRSAPAQQTQQAAAIGAVDSQAGKLPSGAQKLVGAVVPGRVDFSGDVPVQAGGGQTASLSMYRHPADRNAAATAVSMGKSLDVTG